MKRVEDLEQATFQQNSRREPHSTLIAFAYRRLRAVTASLIALAYRSLRAVNGLFRRADRRLQAVNGFFIALANQRLEAVIGLFEMAALAVGQDSPAVGQEALAVGQEALAVRQEALAVGQEAPAVGQQTPIGQQAARVEHNPPTGQSVADSLKLRIAHRQWRMGLLFAALLAFLAGLISVGVYLSQQSVTGTHLTCPKSCLFPTATVTGSCLVFLLLIAGVCYRIIKEEEWISKQLTAAERAERTAAVEAGLVEGDLEGGQWWKKKKINAVFILIIIIIWLSLLLNCWVRICFQHRRQSPNFGS